MRQKSIVCLLLVCLLSVPASGAARDTERDPGLRERIKRFVRVIKSLVPITNGDTLVSPKP